jgi:hypothetical protein
MRNLLIFFALLTSAGYAQTCSEGTILLYEGLCFCDGSGVTLARCNPEDSQYGCNDNGHSVNCGDGCHMSDSGECDPGGTLLDLTRCGILRWGTPTSSAL